MATFQGSHIEEELPLCCTKKELREMSSAEGNVV